MKPVLTGDRTVLRPFTEADAEQMWEIINDPEVERFTGPPGHELTPGLLRTWYGSRGERSDRLDLAVTDPVDGGLLGEVVLNEWKPESRTCTFRTLIGPRGAAGDRHRGDPADRRVRLRGTRAAPHQLDAYADNHRALRVYEKVGFVTEGVRREVEWRDGAWVDEVLMAVLDHQWAAHRGHPRTGSSRPGAGITVR
ncbi:GNAT family N-acetyltransferase [Streptomyces thinghirensis]|nr:GNAT family N-acetyltransferase [Streptomyces thinghirensis]